MRALEVLLARDKTVEVLIIGGDETSYSAPHPSGRPWREVMLDEVDLDRSRVHFLGKVPYHRYLAVLQISAAHIYLTGPFVLSWSMLEAMATGCMVIASDTEPVKEVIDDGINGVLSDFFDCQGLVEKIEAALENPDDFRPMREKARATILQHYSLAQCMPKQIELAERLASPDRLGQMQTVSGAEARARA
jgi:glycosyltransferase involved in cell wall biosynthesis